MDIGPYIMAIIEWAVVPLVLFSILVYALFLIPSGTAPHPVKTSALAGKWAGLVVFAIYVLSLRRAASTFTFRSADYVFVFWPTAAAVLAGFAVGWIFDLIRNTRFVGILALILVAASSISLYSYLFIQTVRNSFVFGLLGFVLGVLLYEILFPAGTPRFWSRAPRTGSRRLPEDRPPFEHEHDDTPLHHSPL